MFSILGAAYTLQIPRLSPHLRIFVRLVAPEGGFAHGPGIPSCLKRRQGATAPPSAEKGTRFRAGCSYVGTRFLWSTGAGEAVGMTLKEKAQVLAGASHWRTHALCACGIDSLVLSDGPHGLRKQEGNADHLGIAESRQATCFPTASALACSFDPDLVRRVGAAIGEEARRQGVDVVLGPGVNIKRHPLCGRNFEYFSEDPLISGELGAAMVCGIQSKGVSACLKHLAGNSQEHARMVSDSVIDERTLRELYLAPFERVIRRSHPWSVMTAYNKLNGVYCSEHEWLLRDVLRGEWGFDGVVVSDWGAMSSSVSSVRAGLDLCMPGPRADHARALVEAVNAGELDERHVTEAVGHIEHLSCRLDEGRRAVPASTLPDEELYRSHADLAREAASQSAVLLKNEGVLPLETSQSVAVIGAFARMPRYQGSGSSRINPKFIDNLWYRLEQRGFAARYADGYEPIMGETSERLLRDAEEAAAHADVAVVVAGLPARYESEGFDRKLMTMPKGQVELIERVCAVNPRTVVVLQGGAPMEMPWRDKPAAILLMYLSGCQGGGAAVDILAGDVSPSGKLAETWPICLGDTALGVTYPDMDREVYYREGPFVGYRYYDAANIEPAYPFGFGMSYTSFVYRDLELTRRCVRLTVENTGAYRGAEVVQLYVAPAPGVVPPSCPPQHLIAFEKVMLSPGESNRIEFALDDEAFRAWDVQDHAWRVWPGAYEVRAAASSRDVRLSGWIDVPAPPPQGDTGGATAVAPALPNMYAQPYPGCFTSLGAIAAFEGLYSSPLPVRPPVVPFTVDSAVEDMEASWLGRRMFRIIDWVMADPTSKMDHIQRTMMKEMAADMPLRSLTTSGVPLGAVEGFVNMLNGRYLSGFMRIIHALVRSIRER